MSPPLRDRSNQDVLWNGLRDGVISTLATDHAPFDFATQKRMGETDFTKIPNGIPSLEDRVNAFYTYGVKRGRLDLHRFVDAASTQAAKLFGLFPRKGAIQPGSDADLVVYDPNYRGTLSVKTQTMNVDYNPFEGMAIEGRPHVVTVRGQVAARDGQVRRPGRPWPIPPARAEPLLRLLALISSRRLPLTSGRSKGRCSQTQQQSKSPSPSCSPRAPW